MPANRLRARRTFETFHGQARSSPESSVRLVRGYRLVQKPSQAAALPWFAEFSPSLRALTPSELARFQRARRKGAGLDRYWSDGGLTAKKQA